MTPSEATEFFATRVRAQAAQTGIALDARDQALLEGADSASPAAIGQGDDQAGAKLLTLLRQAYEREALRAESPGQAQDLLAAWRGAGAALPPGASLAVLVERGLGGKSNANSWREVITLLVTALLLTGLIAAIFTLSHRGGIGRGATAALYVAALALVYFAGKVLEERNSRK